MKTSTLFGNEFILGVNYWPRRKAVGWWGNFDAGEVAEEFGLIGEIGLKLVRIFLLWEDWQPEIAHRATRPCMNASLAWCGRMAR